jgi:protease IV
MDDELMMQIARKKYWLLSMLAIVVSLPACRTRPLMTVMRGDMQVQGDMSMAGDMNVRGDMSMTGQVSTSMRTDNTASRLVSTPVYGNGHNLYSGKICVIDVDGLLLNRNNSGVGSMGENPVALFREKLDYVLSDSSIKALVLRINSSGGGVTATDMMSRDLEQVRTERNIPIVACIMEVGTGGAYYIAVGADHIVALPTSIVGGVGVILNVYNVEDMMGQFGVSPLTLKQGEMIDMGSPTRVMKVEEREALQQIADEFHSRFTERVISRRSLKQIDTSRLDGRVFTGAQALSGSMVDQLGYLDDAVTQARTLAGLDDQTSIVMLRRDNDRAYTLLDVTPNSPTLTSLLPVKIPGLDRSQLPTFLYIWQPEPVPF